MQMANGKRRRKEGGGNALCSHLFECVLKQFFWPIEQAQQQRLTNAVPLQRGRGKNRQWRGGGEYLHPHQSFAATHVNVSEGKSSIIDRCTERSLATVAAGAMPIKIGSATAATAATATAAMSRRVGLSTCPADECAQWAPIHSFQAD